MKKRAIATKGKSLYLVVLLCSFATVGILLVFIALSIIPNISQLLEANAVDRTKDTVRQIGNGIEIYVGNMLSTLGVVADLLPASPSPEDTSYEEQIKLIQKSQQDIRNVAFFGEEGALIYSTGGPLSSAPEAVAACEWFRKAVEWQGTVVYFSDPYVQHIFEGRHEWVISLSRSVEYEHAGRVKTGVLLVDYSASAFGALSNDIQLGESGYVYIVSEGDVILYHPRKGPMDAGVAQEDTKAVREQVVGITRDVQKGRERILLIHTISQTRWRMVGVAYIDEILMLQSAFLRIFMIVLACGGLLSIAGAALTAYFVTRPIHHLQNKMRQVEDGNLNTSITVRGFREIRGLSATFNHMLDRIRSLMEQIVSEQEAKRFHELNALQEQINPHFLYNTLDSIIWIEEQGRSREAIEMILALARLFRISISKGRNIISVREELEHVRNYLFIQKVRFRNTFAHEIIASEEALELRTVKLILQPLVENAVHHAVDPYGQSTLHIVIRVYIEEGCLMMSVKDDGIGIPEAKLQSIMSAPRGKGGIGLRNVNERLELTCGKGYGLKIQSVEDEGTEIIIRQPYDLEEE